MGGRLDRLRAICRQLSRRVSPWASLPTLIGVLGLLVATWQVSFGFCRPTTEWPAGLVAGLATTSEGYRVAALRHADRIQVYDREWRFVRGWNVGVFGKFRGPFVGRDGVITLDTTRGLYRYDIEGRRLPTTPSPGSRHLASLVAWVPGSPWYWFLVNPVACFCLIFAGMGIALLVDSAVDRARR